MKFAVCLFLFIFAIYVTTEKTEESADYFNDDDDDCSCVEYGDDDDNNDVSIEDEKGSIEGRSGSGPTITSRSVGGTVSGTGLQAVDPPSGPNSANQSGNSKDVLKADEDITKHEQCSRLTNYNRLYTNYEVKKRERNKYKICTETGVGFARRGNYKYMLDFTLRTYENAKNFCAGHTSSESYSIFSKYIEEVSTIEKRRELIRLLSIGAENVQEKRKTTRFWMPLKRSIPGNNKYWRLNWKFLNTNSYPYHRLVDLTKTNQGKPEEDKVGWDTNEPSDNKDENCVHTNYHLNGVQRLNNIDCNSVEPVICPADCEKLFEKKPPKKVEEKGSYHKLREDACTGSDHKIKVNTENTFGYYFDETKRTYRESVDFCNSIDGHIVYKVFKMHGEHKEDGMDKEIYGTALKKALRCPVVDSDKCQESSLEKHRYWVGIRHVNGAYWRWADYDYCFNNCKNIGWAKGEPNNLKPTKPEDYEKCAHVNYYKKWKTFNEINNIHCERIESTLCEFDCGPDEDQH